MDYASLLGGLGGSGGGGSKEFGSSQAHAEQIGDQIRGGGSMDWMPLILGGLFVVAFIVILQLARK